LILRKSLKMELQNELPKTALEWKKISLYIATKVFFKILTKCWPACQIQQVSRQLELLIFDTTVEKSQKYLNQMIKIVDQFPQETIYADFTTKLLKETISEEQLSTLLEPQDLSIMETVMNDQQVEWLRERECTQYIMKNWWVITYI